MKEKLSKFQEFIQYKFKNEGLLAQSLTTPRYGNEMGQTHYEFLETLGDAVIKVIFILKLHQKGITDPGRITKIKGSLESDKTLIQVASRMNLQDFIFKNEKQSVKGTTILADVFESICGAIFLDSDNSLSVVREKMIDPFYDDFDSIAETSLLLKKNDLLEFLQDKFKTSILVKLDYERSGLEHNPKWIAKNPKIIERNTHKEIVKLPVNLESSGYKRKKDADKDIYFKILNLLKNRKD
ncbi:MAG: ribonuclease III domain-containing protein [Promethearchaeota archaeon]|jgi:dsRNA-specific ribonuclease